MKFLEGHFLHKDVPLPCHCISHPTRSNQGDLEAKKRICFSISMISFMKTIVLNLKNPIAKEGGDVE